MFSAKLEMRQNNLPKLSATLRRKAADVVKRAAFQCEAQAKIKAPVDTGALRSSIQASEESELAWVVSTGVDYSLWVEMGTVKAPPQPFLTPAAEYVRPRFLSEMSHVAEDAAGG